MRGSEAAPRSNTPRLVRSGESVAAAEGGIHLDHEPAEAMHSGKTQLMFWAAFDSHENVRTLLLRGADVDAVDHDGDTALYYALSVGATSALKELLKHGANPNLSGTSGVPLSVVADRGWTDAARLLVQHGALVDARSTFGATTGVTATMLAAGAGRIDCLLALLEMGADPELLDSDGDSAVHHAQSNGRNETAELLLRRRQAGL